MLLPFLWFQGFRVLGSDRPLESDSTSLTHVH